MEESDCRYNQMVDLVNHNRPKSELVPLIQNKEEDEKFDRLVYELSNHGLSFRYCRHTLPEGTVLRLHPASAHLLSVANEKTSEVLRSLAIGYSCYELIC